MLECTERRLHSFNELKRFITTAPMLSSPRDQCDDYVGEGCCDSSLYSAAAAYNSGKMGFFVLSNMDHVHLTTLRGSTV